MQRMSLGDPNSNYYNMMKIDMLNFIKKGPNTVLDIGCGSGQLGKKLKSCGKAGRVVGIEIFPLAAQNAKIFYDEVIIGNIENINLEYNEYFDYIICGDILEHLINPWDLIRKVYYWLKEDGSVIVTLPNIRYFRILIDLFIRGLWEYKEAGIMDKTHLRFFTNRSAIKMIEENNFIITYNRFIIDGWKKRMFNNITFGIFKDILGAQMMYVFKKT